MFAKFLKVLRTAQKVLVVALRIVVAALDIANSIVKESGEHQVLA